ncbi:MAG: CHAT domain-containing protein [Muribaculum sp.]|nr:CHAT domain-containing protein [Muribaculum sp.]
MIAVLSLLSPSASAFNQWDISEVRFQKVSEYLGHGDCNTAIAVLDTITYDNNVAPHYFYLRGVAEDMCGETKKAQSYLEKCIHEFDKSGYKDEIYLDATIRLIDFYRNSEGTQQRRAELARNALAAPKSVLESYPLTYALYECYVQALNDLWKTTDVESIVKEGLPYVEKSLKPTEQEYYNLRFMEIIAMTIMNRWERAESKLNDLTRIHNAFGNLVIDDEIRQLTEIVSRHKETMDWRKNADRHIDWAYDAATSMIILNPANTEEGAETWKKFFNVLIDDLELHHYDISNPQDEKYWSRLLACAIVYFGSTCQEMPGREQLAYDLILLRKNFLDYHTGLLHNVPKRWQDVRDALSEGELAVEITMYPDEVLILGKDYEAPVAIPIPEELSERISEYSPTDAVTVNQYYSKGSPLSEIVDLLTPYIAGIKTIYLSPTNMYAQFNFGVAPFLDDRLDDHVKVVQITTTADIAHCKKTSGIHPAPDSSVLIGGVDYDAKTSRIPKVDMTRSSQLPDDLRSGYGRLPYSLKEVENISTILGPDNCILLTGKDATEEAFHNLSGTTGPILHIATHGYSIPKQPDTENDSVSNIGSALTRTGLLLAGANKNLHDSPTLLYDGILTSDEIAHLDLSHIQLAVLSFCSSGLGDLTNTTGVVYGVANAMKTSGIPQILMALWDIPDEATSEAMTLFYKNLMTGITAREALELTRKDMISKGYNDPYYWASFMVLN